VQVRIVLREYIFLLYFERARVNVRTSRARARWKFSTEERFCSWKALSFLSLPPNESGGKLSPFQNALLEGMRGIATRELHFKRVERDVGCVFRAMWRCGR